MQTKDRWKRSNTVVYNLGYHIIWCPKYRRKVLIDGVDKRLEELIRTKCNELLCDVCSLEIMPDHVHLFVKTPPTIGVHFLIQQIKGNSAHVLRNEFPELKSKLPNLWTRSYFVESVGCISEESIIKYIENQKNK